MNGHPGRQRHGDLCLGKLGSQCFIGRLVPCQLRAWPRKSKQVKLVGQLTQNQFYSTVKTHATMKRKVLLTHNQMHGIVLITQTQMHSTVKTHATIKCGVMLTHAQMHITVLKTQNQMYANIGTNWTHSMTMLTQNHIYNTVNKMRCKTTVLLTQNQMQCKHILTLTDSTVHPCTVQCYQHRIKCNVNTS